MASSWPRRTCACAARAPSSARARRGQSDLRLASLSDPGDRLLLDEARRVADAIVSEDPVLSSLPLLAEEIKLFLSEDEEAYLFQS